MAKDKEQKIVMRRNGIPLEGPRYDAALEKDKEPNCYKDFWSGDQLAEAKRQADEAAAQVGRRAIVWDNVEMEITYRCGKEPEKPTPAAPPPPPPRRGRK